MYHPFNHCLKAIDVEVKELTILWSIVRIPGCSIYHVFIYT